MGPGSPMTSFSLTSFNARWGLTVEDQPFDLARAVRDFDTDVVVLQELWEPAEGGSGLPEAAAQLGYRLVHAPLSPSFVVPAPNITAHPSEAAGTWGVALLSRLPLHRTRIVNLGRMVERWDVADREAILADVGIGTSVVTVAALHLSFALPNALAQIRRLSGYLPRHQPTVVAGDCNLWGPLATSVLQGHRRAVRGRTWPSARPHSQLDHILVSPSIEVVEATVLGPHGSDHRPVQARLRIR